MNFATAAKNCERVKRPAEQSKDQEFSVNGKPAAEEGGELCANADRRSCESEKKVSGDIIIVYHQ